MLANDLQLSYLTIYNYHGQLFDTIKVNYLHLVDFLQLL